MLGIPVKVRDQRGRLHVRRGRRWAIDRQRMGCRAGEGNIRKNWLYWLTILPLGFASFYWEDLLGHQAIPLWLSLSVYMAVMLVYIPWTLLIIRRQLVLGMVASRRCAVCNYDLLDLAAAEDGCTVCPECGAAWRLGG